jgi:glutamyl-tRNA synthetase
VHQVVEQSAAELGLGLGKIAQPLRVAMTGTHVSPSIEDTVYLAGRAEALKRIDAALAMAQG